MPAKSRLFGAAQQRWIKGDWEGRVCITAHAETGVTGDVKGRRHFEEFREYVR
jgi:hypothetical protein